MCAWTSTKPGMIVLPAASTTCAPAGRVTLPVAPTSTTRLPEMTTSPFSMTPSLPEPVIVTMTGSGNDGVIEKGDVVISGNRVVEVGATGKVTRPAGAHVVDAAGKTIMPGFVDVHAHMWPPHGVH